MSYIVAYLLGRWYHLIGGDYMDKLFGKKGEEINFLKSLYELIESWDKEDEKDGTRR